jgi:protein-S-isoprenylcysteine O-methyltransferase Ste14
MTNVTAQSSASRSVRRYPLVKAVFSILIAGGAVALLLLGVAGQPDWVLGWAFIILWIVPKLGMFVYLSWRDPSLLAERMNKHENTQPFDKIILPIYYGFSFGTLLVAGLDRRMGWSGPMPAVLVAIGIGIFTVMHVIPAWTMLTNTYASSVARIQSDRAQQVISTGPYRYVRHPMYASGIFILLTMPLFLESWWALIPAALAALLMMVRTWLEDRLLHRELPGYADYARRTRYRLLPGIW